jgi:phosphotransferase family enzyme
MSAEVADGWFESAVASMLEISIKDLELELIPAGGNNQVYRLRTPRRTLLLKRYRIESSEHNGRLEREFAFATFAWKYGIRCVPEPVAADHQAGFGLYEFVEGRSLNAEEVAWPRVAEALRFFVELNGFRDREGAQGLLPAAEACCSVDAHLRLVGSRVARLQDLPGDSPVEKEARAFVTANLVPGWELIRKRTEVFAGGYLKTELQLADQCVSPSDFGFHNAIIEPNGAARFIDFEYAGWDDPAKMACDFFSQPRVPIPEMYLADFLRGVASQFPNAHELEARVEALLPVYRVKWCCILLNEFIPETASRRAYARRGEVADSAKSLQLDKARAALARIESASGQLG